MPGWPLCCGRGPCLAQGTRYPIAYRFDGGIVRLPGGSIQWLDVLAPRGLEVIAFAADWAMWSLSVALVLYLLSPEVRRQHDPSGPGPVASSPAPASRETISDTGTPWVTRYDPAALSYFRRLVEWERNARVSRKVVVSGSVGHLLFDDGIGVAGIDRLSEPPTRAYDAVVGRRIALP